MARVINFCFSCRFGWTAEEAGKITACPQCHGGNTAFTKRLREAEPKVSRQAFEDLVVAVMKDPELKKINSEYLPLYWKLKGVLK